MSEIDIAPKESDVQSAIIEITTKKITDLTNQTILLEANLLACQNNLRLQINASKDVSTELDSFKESYTDKLEKTEKENLDLNEELKEKLEAVNGNNNTVKEKSG